MIFHEPSFWVDLSFVLLGIFIFIKAKPQIKAKLDVRIATIAKELDEARDMRERASRELAEVLFRDKNAERDVAQIKQQTNEEVKELRRVAQQERVLSVKRTQLFAQERLEQLESRWQSHLRDAFVSATLSASETFLQRAAQDSKTQSFLFERALDRLPRTIIEQHPSQERSTSNS